MSDVIFPSCNFVCPKCGSGYFRTPGRTDGPVEGWQRECKGRLLVTAYGSRYEPCDFRWLGKDDALYGLGRPCALAPSDPALEAVTVPVRR